MASPNIHGGSTTPRGIHLFKIAGIQITVDFSWFIIFILILWSLSAGYFPREFPGQSTADYWVAGFIAALFFFVSVVLHELSHSLMAIRSGIAIPEITLFIFGGVSRLSEDARDAISEFKIAVVGPLSSLILGFCFWVVKGFLPATHPTLAVTIIGYLAWINVVLALFNLIPGFPLDGGRILRAFIWWKTGSLSYATKWASDIGKGFAVALMILGGYEVFSGLLIGGMWLIFIGVFLRGVAEGGYQEVVIRQTLEGVSVEEVMVQGVITVPPDLSIDRLIKDYFLRYGYKAFPVTREETVLGIVTIYAIKDLPEGERDLLTAQELMNPLEDSLCIDAKASLAEALRRMRQQDTAQLLILEGTKVRGMITKTGLLRLLELKRILQE